MDYTEFAEKVQAIIDANPTQPPTTEEYALIDAMRATLKPITIDRVPSLTSYGSLSDAKERLKLLKSQNTSTTQQQNIAHTLKLINTTEEDITSSGISLEENIALEQSILQWNYYKHNYTPSSWVVSFRLMYYIRAGYIYHHLLKHMKTTTLIQTIQCTRYGIGRGNIHYKKGRKGDMTMDGNTFHNYTTQLPYELAMMAYSCYVAPTHTRTLEERLEALEAKQKETEDTYEEDMLGEGMDVGANATVSLESYLQLQKEVERLTDIIRAADELVESIVD